MVSRAGWSWPSTERTASTRCSQRSEVYALMTTDTVGVEVGGTLFVTIREQCRIADIIRPCGSTADAPGVSCEIHDLAPPRRRRPRRGPAVGDVDDRIVRRRRGHPAHRASGAARDDPHA